MKILIAAKHPPNGAMKIGGVQSWSVTIADQLRIQGHEVVFWGPELPLPEGRFERGVFSNFMHTARAAALCDDYVVVSHGVVKDERPGTGRTLYTSEEGRSHWGTPGSILRQPIDTEFWSPRGFRGNKLVFYSYRAPGLAVGPVTAWRLGLEFVHIKNVAQEVARDAMRNAACVLASGRAALEAMACGAPVVICDHRAPYQSALMDANIERQMKINYSGRGGSAPDVDSLCSAIVSAQDRRDHILLNHDARKIAKELMCTFS